MKEIKHAELAAIPPIDIVNAINTGATIVNATFPFVKDLFAKIAELVASIQTDALSTPKGKRKAIEELQRVTEARNIVQKELNKLYDAYFKQLADKGLIEL